MRIAFLVLEFPSTSATFIQNQIVGVIEAGHEVTIFADKANNNLKIGKEYEKYNLASLTIYTSMPANLMHRLARGLKFLTKFALKYPIPILRAMNVFKYGRKSASLSLLYQVILFLEKGPYDILHCQFGPLGFQGLCIKQIVAGPTKLVTSFRGFDITAKIFDQSGIYNELFEKGDLFLPVSHSIKKRIVRRGCPEEKIVVLASGIDCEKLPYSKKTVGPAQSRKVITIARLIEKKGIHDAIEAIARVIASGRDVIYDVVGEGVLRGNLEKLIQERKLQNHVRLLGRKNHDEVIRLLQGAHILIAPSMTAANGDQEGIPNAIKEAMAAGLPVISTFHSGIPELVKDGVSGFLVQERDVNALADRLTYLIDHPEKWADMGRAGRERVESDYDIRALNKRLLELYEQLCGKT